ncbi:MAG: fimbrillin family protein, partial [Alistipes sp.]
MRIKRTVSRLIAMATLLVAAACTDGIIRNSEIIPDRRIPIAWSYYSDDNPSRGMHTITYDILKDCHFGVFATATGNNDFDDNSIAGNYLYNHEFGDGADDIWRGIPTAYWPLGSSSKLSFFLYAPYDATLEHIKLDGYERGALQFDYSPSADNIAGQFDLCVADAALTLNRTYSTSPIDVSFVHCLTKVMLYARYAGASTSGYQVRIDEVA